MRLHRFALGAAVVAVAPAAHAAREQPAPKALAETLTGDAKAAYDAGKLLFGDGDYAGAEIKFEAAYDASHDARLLWNMAACEKSQRHYARTEQLVRRYLDEGGAELTQQDRDGAKALLDLIESFTVKLSITVNEAGAEVFVDGASVGTSPLAKPVVVDIGARKIAVRKDGFRNFEQELPVGGSATARIDVTLQAQVHEGHVTIVTQPDAEIFIDGKSVGRGRYDHTMKSGGYTLRVVAPDMQPYQSELVVTDDERRAVDVPLEPVVRVAAEPPKLWSPGGEISASLAAGDKMRAGGAAAFDLRLEIGWKPGWPTELAFVVDVGSIDPASGVCATDYHGPTPTSSSDLAARYAFANCLYVKPGLSFAIHFLPRSKFDVYMSLEAGFRFGFASSHSYDPLNGPATTTTEFIPGVDTGGRLGIDYHPFRRGAPGTIRPSAASQWSVGVFASLLATVVSKESPDGGTLDDVTNTPSVANHHFDPAPVYPWLLFGVRTSLTF